MSLRRVGQCREFAMGGLRRRHLLAAMAALGPAFSAGLSDTRRASVMWMSRYPSARPRITRNALSSKGEGEHALGEIHVKAVTRCSSWMEKTRRTLLSLDERFRLSAPGDPSLIACFSQAALMAVTGLLIYGHRFHAKYVPTTSHIESGSYGRAFGTLKGLATSGNAWLTLLVIQFAVTCLTLCLLHEPTPPPEPDQAACREIIAPQEPTPPPEPDQAACREIIAPQETDGEQHGRGGAWRREQPELTVALAAVAWAAALAVLSQRQAMPHTSKHGPPDSSRSHGQSRDSPHSYLILTSRTQLLLSECSQMAGLVASVLSRPASVADKCRPDAPCSISTPAS